MWYYSNGYPIHLGVIGDKLMIYYYQPYHNYDIPTPALPESKKNVRDGFEAHPKTLERLEKFIDKRPGVDIWPSLNDRIDEEINRFLDDCEEAEKG